MKLSVITVLAALSLSLLACEEKKGDTANPSATSTAAAAKTTTPASSAKPAGSGW